MQLLGKILDALRQYVERQPLSFLFFCLGTVLLLLGLTTGFQSLAPEQNLRAVSIVLGSAALGAAVILYYFGPARMQLVASPPATVGDRSVLVRDNLTESQQRLLSIVERLTARQIDVLQEDVEKQFEASQSELYYRLEQLRLMGFIERNLIAGYSQQPQYGYRLSDRYSQQLGRPARGLPPPLPSVLPPR